VLLIFMMLAVGRKISLLLSEYLRRIHSATIFAHARRVRHSLSRLHSNFTFVILSFLVLSFNIHQFRQKWFSSTQKAVATCNELRHRLEDDEDALRDFQTFSESKLRHDALINAGWDLVSTRQRFHETLQAHQDQLRNILTGIQNPLTPIIHLIIQAYADLLQRERAEFLNILQQINNTSPRLEFPTFTARLSVHSHLGEKLRKECKKLTPSFNHSVSLAKLEDDARKVLLVVIFPLSNSVDWFTFVFSWGTIFYAIIMSDWSEPMLFILILLFHFGRQYVVTKRKEEEAQLLPEYKGCILVSLCLPFYEIFGYLLELYLDPDLSPFWKKTGYIFSLFIISRAVQYCFHQWRRSAAKSFLHACLSLCLNYVIFAILQWYRPDPFETNIFQAVLAVVVYLLWACVLFPWLDCILVFWVCMLC